IQTGNVPTPDCLSTFGLLGAELSCSTLHFALPVPVTALFQPGGAAPAFASSKLIVSASAVPDKKPAQIISVYMVFIVSSRYLLSCFVRSKMTYGRFTSPPMYLRRTGRRPESRLGLLRPVSYPVPYPSSEKTKCAVARSS